MRITSVADVKVHFSAYITPRFRRLLEAAEERIQQTGGVKHDDFWASLETTV